MIDPVINNSLALNSKKHFKKAKIYNEYQAVE